MLYLVVSYLLCGVFTTSLSIILVFAEPTRSSMQALQNSRLLRNTQRIPVPYQYNYVIVATFIIHNQV